MNLLASVVRSPHSSSLAVCNLDVRYSAILSICWLGILGRKINRAKDKQARGIKLSRKDSQLLIDADKRGKDFIANEKEIMKARGVAIDAKKAQEKCQQELATKQDAIKTELEKIRKNQDALMREGGPI